MKLKSLPKNLLDAFANQDWAQVVSYLSEEQSNAMSGDEVELCIVLGVSHFNLKNFRLAREYFSQGLAIERDNVFLNIWMAKCRLRIRGYEGEAAKYYWKAFNIDSKAFSFEDIIDFRSCLYTTSFFEHEQLQTVVIDKQFEELFMENPKSPTYKLYKFQYLMAANCTEDAYQLIKNDWYTDKMQRRVRSVHRELYLSMLEQLELYEDAINYIELSGHYDLKSSKVIRRVKNLKVLLQTVKELIVDDYGYKITMYRNKTKLDNKKLIITFGTISTHKKTAPFGLYFLLSKGFDVAWVAQSSLSYYNLLSFERFGSVMQSYVEPYGTNVFTYGSSLGAYAALYYSGAINANVIAASPLNPAHPSIEKFHKKRKSIVSFKHKDMVNNPVTGGGVYIIRDSKEKNDKAFFDLQVSPAFPNAKILDLPYAGHTLLETISETGCLSDFILSIINDGKFYPIYSKVCSTSKFHYEKSRALMVDGNFSSALKEIEFALSIKKQVAFYMHKVECMRLLNDLDGAKDVLLIARCEFPNSRVLNNLSN